MIGSGFGGAAAGSGEFEALSRQYWKAWSEALRAAGSHSGVDPSALDWQQALRGWAQYLPDMPAEAREAMGRFQLGAGGWYAQMQKLAAQFAGQPASPADIAAAWRSALESAGGAGNPFAVLLQASPLNGIQSFEAWLEQVMPFLQGLQGAAADPARWLHMPTFGLTREHQERWQELAKALADYQQRNSEYQAAINRVLQAAYGVFERKLAEHQGPGRQLASARGLFDVWIDAAEEAYAEAALSEEFRDLQGELTNAQMRLRQAVQTEVEKVCGLFGMPTRSEVDSAHRKIAQLERQLRELNRQARAAGTSAKPAPTTPTEKKPAASKARAVPKKAAKKAEKPTAKKVAKAAKATPKANKAAPAGKQNKARKGAKK